MSYFGPNDHNVIELEERGQISNPIPTAASEVQDPHLPLETEQKTQEETSGWRKTLRAVGSIVAASAVKVGAWYGIEWAFPFPKYLPTKGELMGLIAKRSIVGWAGAAGPEYLAQTYGLSELDKLGKPKILGQAIGGAVDAAGSAATLAGLNKSSSDKLPPYQFIGPAFSFAGSMLQAIQNKTTDQFNDESITIEQGSSGSKENTLYQSIIEKLRTSGREVDDYSNNGVITLRLQQESADKSVNRQWFVSSCADKGDHAIDLDDAQEKIITELAADRKRKNSRSIKGLMKSLSLPALGVGLSAAVGGALTKKPSWRGLSLGIGSTAPQTLAQWAQFMLPKDASLARKWVQSWLPLTVEYPMLHGSIASSQEGEMLAQKTGVPLDAFPSGANVRNWQNCAFSVQNLLQARRHGPVTKTQALGSLVTCGGAGLMTGLEYRHYAGERKKQAASTISQPSDSSELIKKKLNEREETPSTEMNVEALQPPSTLANSTPPSETPFTDMVWSTFMGHDGDASALQPISTASSNLPILTTGTSTVHLLPTTTHATAMSPLITGGASTHDSTFSISPDPTSATTGNIALARVAGRLISQRFGAGTVKAGAVARGARCDEDSSKSIPKANRPVTRECGR